MSVCFSFTLFQERTSIVWPESLHFVLVDFHCEFGFFQINVMVKLTLKVALGLKLRFMISVLSLMLYLILFIADYSGSVPRCCYD